MVLQNKVQLGGFRGTLLGYNAMNLRKIAITAVEGFLLVIAIIITVLTRHYAPPFCRLDLASSMGGLIIE